MTHDDTTASEEGISTGDIDDMHQQIDELIDTNLALNQALADMTWKFNDCEKELAKTAGECIELEALLSAQNCTFPVGKCRYQFGDQDHLP
jgi:hypothetical protein